MSTKDCAGFCLFCLELELFAKIKKYLVSTDSQNSRSKQNKKDPTHPFVDIHKTETYAKFQQKILNSTLVGARQSSQFWRQIT